MPRFALLEHDRPFPHWDLLLERAGVLWTWRLPALPVTGLPLSAARSADHRLLYLEYEGPVSGNRGSVKRVDGGELVWIEGEAARIAVTLEGKLYAGRLEGALQPDGSWRLVYRSA